jgi:small subunit ribosomal protein S12
MPTTHQLINHSRVSKSKRLRTPALKNAPQKKGVCLRVYIKSPKKLNFAV